MLTLCRRSLYLGVLATCMLMLWHALAVEAFHIPSGSMAPTLHGHHRVCACPRCGHQVVVGSTADADRAFRKAFCPNCGFYPVPVANALEIPGQQIRVNKSAYLVRPPARWEVVVFRLLGTFYIKRLLGLPGEEILIKEGDLYVNGKLVRKTLAEARSMRIPVFDHDLAPADGWQKRWLSADRKGSPTNLDGRGTPTTLTYQNYLLDAGKCEPIRDEYAYNGGLRADSECVHDFLIETDIIATDTGTLALRLCDGADWIEVRLPIGSKRRLEAHAWPTDAPTWTRKLAESDQAIVLRSNQRYRVELAFVDRRISLAIDGRLCLSADLPEASERAGVERPFQAYADGVTVRLEHFRLYRDVHYGQQGEHGVCGKTVRLGANQYFMLGDNSPTSQDSRFWPDQGRIERASLVGPVSF